MVAMVRPVLLFYFKYFKMDY